MTTPTTLNLALANPVPGREAEFERWYENVHIPDLLAAPGIVSAQRFVLDPNSEAVLPPPAQRYLVVYELDGDFQTIMGEVGTKVATGEILLSDAMDILSVAMSFGQPIGPQVTAHHPRHDPCAHG